MKPKLRYDIIFFGNQQHKASFFELVQARLHAILTQQFDAVINKQSPQLVFALRYRFPKQVEDFYQQLFQLRRTIKLGVQVVWVSFENSFNDNAFLSNLYPISKLFDYTIKHAAPSTKNILISSLFAPDSSIPPQQLNHPKTRFCNFVYSNALGSGAQQRMTFCKKLMAYKHIDCPGKVLNNMDTPLPYGQSAKLDFLSHYKFTIAFENDMHNWYVSEKIVHPLRVRSIPIYYGCRQAAKIYNPKSFINVHDYPSFDACIEHIKAVDQDPALMAQYLQANPNGHVASLLNPEFARQKAAKQLLTIAAYARQDKLSRPIVYASKLQSLHRTYLTGLMLLYCRYLAPLRKRIREVFLK